MSLAQRILLEDGPLLALAKPYGWLTQGPPHVAQALVHQVKEFLKRREGKTGRVYLGVPHRLDRATTGVVVFAKNSKAAARLAEQFRERQVRKEYLAVVAGPMPQPEGELRHWLRKIDDRPQVECSDQPTEGAREAVLDYRTLQTGNGRTTLLLTPRTGRMHQLRAQLAAVGRPIVGDGRYGSPEMLPLAAADLIDDTHPIDPPLALHAHRLTLKHPVRYDELTIEAPLPPHWPGEEESG